jgi:hypothetical protein
MLNKKIKVPKNTIAVFTDSFTNSWYYNDKDRLKNVIDKPPKKRDWFTPHFYKCLPLSIGNQYGFIIKSEFDFSFIWDGSDSPDGISFFPNMLNKELEDKHPNIESHFGHGIITISTPFWLRTPPGVNLMTINPPNYVIPNITAMTGVVETDNLRRNFSFNLKIQIPNIEVKISAGSALAAFIPIPRYYADKFELKYAEDIFSEELIDEEIQAYSDTMISRFELETEKAGRHYLLGKDIYENKFPDHQNF